MVSVISTAYDAAQMTDNTRLGNTGAGGARHAGQVAIVTGAALGIGRATAIRLAAEGATVVACDVNEDALAETAATIEAAGDTVSAVPADVSKQSDVDAVVAEAATRGPVTILANVAGIADYFLPVAELDDDTWDRIIAVNLTGGMRFARAAVPLMEQAGRGSITNIASVAALGGGGGGTAYTAAKHGVIGLTKSIAFLYVPRGIRCNAICPGGVATTIAQTSGYPKVEWAGERLMASFALSSRLAEPEEIAGLISFLSSDEAVNLNGAVIASDGGWTSA
jgi:NAD(P)-dependent dehydrogenase (short-subunit alcohol dehydrogenase family)